MEYKQQRKKQRKRRRIADGRKWGMDRKNVANKEAPYTGEVCEKGMEEMERSEIGIDYIYKTFCCYYI